MRAAARHERLSAYALPLAASCSRRAGSRASAARREARSKASPGWYPRATPASTRVARSPARATTDGQRDPRVRDHPLVVKADPQIVQSDQPVIVHYQGDLLTPAPGCPNSLGKPCSGGHSLPRTGQTQLRGGSRLNRRRSALPPMQATLQLDEFRQTALRILINPVPRWRRRPCMDRRPIAPAGAGGRCLGDAAPAAAHAFRVGAEA